MKTCYFDIESRGLKSDYGSLLVVSIKPEHHNPITFTRNDFKCETDRMLALAAKKSLEVFHLWVGFYSKMFDIPFLNTRLLKHGEEPISQRLHLDLYPHLAYHTNLTSKSLAAYGKFFGLEEKKLDLPQETWEKALQDKKAMRLLVDRCESDTRLTEQLTERTGQVIRNITR